jgi:hypothetical protein
VGCSEQSRRFGLTDGGAPTANTTSGHTEDCVIGVDSCSVPWCVGNTVGMDHVSCVLCLHERAKPNQGDLDTNRSPGAVTFVEGTAMCEDHALAAIEKKPRRWGIERRVKESSGEAQVKQEQADREQLEQKVKKSGLTAYLPVRKRRTEEEKEEKEAKPKEKEKEIQRDSRTRRSR